MGGQAVCLVHSTETKQTLARTVRFALRVSGARLVRPIGLPFAFRCQRSVCFESSYSLPICVLSVRTVWTCCCCSIQTSPPRRHRRGPSPTVRVNRGLMLVLRASVRLFCDGVD
jgi:hypothetical protein